MATTHLLGTFHTSTRTYTILTPSTHEKKQLAAAAAAVAAGDVFVYPTPLAGYYDTSCLATPACREQAGNFGLN